MHDDRLDATWALEVKAKGPSAEVVTWIVGEVEESLIQRDSNSTEDRPRRAHHGIKEGRDGAEGGSYHPDRVQCEGLSIKRPRGEGNTEMARPLPKAEESLGN